MHFTPLQFCENANVGYFIYSDICVHKNKTNKQTKKNLTQWFSSLSAYFNCSTERRDLTFLSEPSLWNETFISATYFFMHVTFWKTGSSPTVRVSATMHLPPPPSSPVFSKHIRWYYLSRMSSIQRLSPWGL